MIRLSGATDHTAVSVSWYACGTYVYVHTLPPVVCECNFILSVKTRIISVWHAICVKLSFCRRRCCCSPENSLLYQARAHYNFGVPIWLSHRMLSSVRFENVTFLTNVLLLSTQFVLERLVCKSSMWWRIERRRTTERKFQTAPTVFHTNGKHVNGKKITTQ